MILSIFSVNQFSPKCEFFFSGNFGNCDVTIPNSLESWNRIEGDNGKRYFNGREILLFAEVGSIQEVHRDFAKSVWMLKAEEKRDSLAKVFGPVTSMGHPIGRGNGIVQR